MAAISTATYLAAAAVAVSAGSAIASSSSQRAGAKQSRNANALRQRADAIQQQRERAKQIREARVKAAQINSATNASGVTGSSVQAGGIGDVQSTGAANVNFLDQVGGLTTASNSALSRANDYYGSSNTFSSISNIGFQFAGYAASEEGGKDISHFKSKVKGVF